MYNDRNYNACVVPEKYYFTELHLCSSGYHLRRQLLPLRVLLFIPYFILVLLLAVFCIFYYPLMYIWNFYEECRNENDDSRTCTQCYCILLALFVPFIVFGWYIVFGLGSWLFFGITYAFFAPARIIDDCLFYKTAITSDTYEQFKDEDISNEPTVESVHNESATKPQQPKN